MSVPDPTDTSPYPLELARSLIERERSGSVGPEIDVTTQSVRPAGIQILRRVGLGLLLLAVSAGASISTTLWVSGRAVSAAPRATEVADAAVDAPVGTTTVETVLVTDAVWTSSPAKPAASPTTARWWPARPAATVAPQKPMDAGPDRIDDPQQDTAPRRPKRPIETRDPYPYRLSE